jgi:hypothetical protein
MSKTFEYIYLFLFLKKGKKKLQKDAFEVECEGAVQSKDGLN